MRDIVRRDIWKILAIPIVSLILGVSFQFSFVRQSLAGDLIFRPEQAPELITAAAKETKIEKITLAQAKELFDNKSAVFIDARTGLWFQVGHIPGAISVPVEDYGKNIKSADLEKYKDTTLVVYCSGKDCTDSHNLAKKLLKDGYSKIDVFEGGWPEWSEAGYPIEKKE